MLCEHSRSSARLRTRQRPLCGFPASQNVKNGSLGAWSVVHDLNLGRYFVEEQTGPNATCFAQISRGFYCTPVCIIATRELFWGAHSIVPGDKHAPRRAHNSIRATSGARPQTTMTSGNDHTMITAQTSLHASKRPTIGSRVPQKRVPSWRCCRPVYVT